MLIRRPDDFLPSEITDPAVRRQVRSVTAKFTRMLDVMDEDQKFDSTSDYFSMLVYPFERMLREYVRLSSRNVPGASRQLAYFAGDIVPRTEAVRPERAEALWAARRGLFFKPASGFGSRGAYRGDKLTRRVFEEILAGDYIASDYPATIESAVQSGVLAGRSILKRCGLKENPLFQLD